MRQRLATGITGAREVNNHVRAQSLLKQTSFRARGSLFENTGPGLLCPTSLLLRLRKVRTNRLSTFVRRRPLFEKS